jgi:hypothetical protein
LDSRCFEVGEELADAPYRLEARLERATLATVSLVEEASEASARERPLEVDGARQTM